MASDRRKEIREEDVQGLKYFRSLQLLLKRLHEVGTERDTAGNRDLHMDQYCTLILIWLFSPIVDSPTWCSASQQLRQSAEEVWRREILFRLAFGVGDDL